MILNMTYEKMNMPVGRGDGNALFRSTIFKLDREQRSL